MDQPYLFAVLDHSGKMIVGCTEPGDAQALYFQEIGRRVLGGYRPRRLGEQETILRHPEYGIVRINWYAHDADSDDLPSVRYVALPDDINAWPVA